MASNAERQRRYRAHQRGDHSLCPPERACDGVTETPVTRNGDVPQAPELGARGRRLWRELHGAGPLSPAETVLAEEACRLADRLDRFDRLLRGEDREWLRLTGELGDVVTLRVDGLLSEARQQQVALKQIVGELRQQSRRPGTGQPDAPRQGRALAPASAPQGGGVADLTVRIAERRANTAG